MKYLAACCILAFFIFSCSDQKNTRETITSPATAPDTAAIVQQTPLSEIKTDPQEIPVAVASRFFSDSTQPDTFRLELTGSKLIDAKALFTIHNPQGDTIWKETFSASDLEAALVYEMKTPIATLPERRAFIRKRVNEFFDEKNFSKPAIAPNDSFDPLYGDQATWEAIKNDKNAVGFNYLLGKENGRRLAYSKRTKKAMLVGFFGN